MEALLASLPRSEGHVVKTPGEGSSSGSVLSSGGLDDCDSDNVVSHLLKGGDSLTALRHRPVSGITNSASSRRSRPSTSVSRQSIASRGRPLKPHEGDPFLSVVTCAISPRAPHSPNTNTANVPVISVENDDLLTPYDLTNGISTDYRPASELVTGGRESTNSPSSRPAALDATPRAKTNVLVKTPFKHASVKGSKTKASTPHPGQLLRERTTCATSSAKSQIAKQGSEEEKKTAGRLLKGRLRSMRPVNTVWPTVQNCRGIVSDKHAYGPSPSSSRGRRDYVFDSILREYSRRDTEGTESIHHTSIASSETDEKSIEADVESLSGDVIARVHNVNSAEDVHAFGAQCHSVSDIVVKNENDDKNPVHLTKERPRTACVKSSLKVSKKNSVGRPFSASVAETGSTKGSKMVRFVDGSKSLYSKSDETLNPNMYGEALPDEIENTYICPLENDMKHGGENSVPEDQNFDLDAKKSKVSRNSCRAFNFFMNGESCDEDSDEGDTFDTKRGQLQGKTSKNSRDTSNNLSQAESSTDSEPAASGNQNTNRNCCDCVEDVWCSSDDVLCSSDDVCSDRRERKPCRDTCDKPTVCFSVTDESKKQNGTIECPEGDNFVLEKTHVFNFVASQSKSLNGHSIYASHTSAEYNMSPRGRVNSPLRNESGSIPPLTFESLEAEISSVQKDIRHFLENNAEMDELETHRDHNLDDLVVNQTPCQVLTLYDNSREISDDTLDTSESEDEKVAVIAVDSEDDEIAESLFTSRAHYSDMLLSGELIQKQIDAELMQTKKTLKPPAKTKHSTKSAEVGRTDEDKLNSDYFMMASMASETDSGCGSEVMSVSHGDLSILDDINQDEDKITDQKQTGYSRKGGKEAVGSICFREKDVSSLKVVATTKDLLKLRKGKTGFSLSAQHPPLCFRINARPPTGQLYYFAYGTEMNSDRLSTFIQRQIENRLWGVLYGFRVCFNKKGIDSEAGGFPNITVDRDSSVEGCLYLLTASELDRLDRYVGYPQHYEHVLFPVWMSNCHDPDNYGVALNCVPAVMYIAQDNWVDKGSCKQSDYSVNQCLKAADLLTPAYKEFLYSCQSGAT
ncbi:uncharacterized protein LOC135480309 [Liolophura sinensis]|uniref:uncharacterized protein LOC135480309 n=1 Tax=Liolophura sinensis TaxID=3198878 RepID=UPI003158C87B